MHPYTVILLVRVKHGKLRNGQANGILVSWLRTIECIPQQLYIPDTWGNTQYMTVKLMPGGEYDIGDIQGWRMHQGIDSGYLDLSRQAASIEGVQQLLQGMPAVRSI